MCVLIQNVAVSIKYLVDSHNKQCSTMIPYAHKAICMEDDLPKGWKHYVVLPKSPEAEKKSVIADDVCRNNSYPEIDLQFAGEVNSRGEHQR